MTALRLLAAMAATTLAAATLAGPADASNKVKYQCKNGTVLTVMFKATKATVSLPGADNVTLPQALSGDGFLYAGKGYSLRGVGKSVTWTTKRGKSLSCKAR